MAKITEAQAKDISYGISYGLFNPSLKGMTICLTGTMSIDRNDLKSLLTILGARVQSSVTTTTDLLVVPNGDEFRKGSKYNAALEKGVTIYSEEDLANLMVNQDLLF